MIPKTLSVTQFGRGAKTQNCTERTVGGPQWRNVGLEMSNVDAELPTSNEVNVDRDVPNSDVTHMDTEVANSDVTSEGAPSLDTTIPCVSYVRAAVRRAKYIQKIDPIFRLTEDPEEFHPDLLDLELRNTFGPDFLECYIENFSSIRNHQRFACKYQDLFNFRVEDREFVFSKLPFEKVYNYYSCHFKVTASYGFIMENMETGEFSYFHPSDENFRILESPKLIAEEGEFLKFLEELKSKNPYSDLERPGYMWQIRFITNVAIYVYKFENFKMKTHCPIRGDFGCGCPFPSLIKYKKSLTTFMDHDDELCFFRCIALGKKS